MKGNRMAKRSSFGSIVRKRLSDITNSIPQPKSPIPHKKVSPPDSSAKECIDHLVKENIALAKLVADKNQIIEFTGIELQKMRINLQKMQLQNWNLAQSNSHILAEINLCKEKLKALQHDNVCKDALLKSKNLELGGKAKTNSQKNCSQEGEEAVDELTSNDNSKLCEGQRRRPTRSQCKFGSSNTMGPSTTSKQVAEKETSESKRRCLRRQSARFRYQQHEPNEDLFEIEDAKFLLAPTPFGSPIRKEENDENWAPAGSDARESQRTSLGRPMRRAVQKVQSYKETPLNIKMRRSG
ncbi:shugoshin-1-like isoform X2 [Camellia sinensis]|uniref:shugoshin-1-like isoform X2 n=1 Tax=Camellia sinensis TaxID=4442 RepID=UPI001035A1FD|nr:shugoshin-1-like isoform X2 [Camellia sinensis]